MKQQEQDRQLARIPRLLETINQISARNQSDKRLPGLEKEYERRLAECRAFSLSDAGEGFMDKVQAAIAKVSEQG